MFHRLALPGVLLLGLLVVGCGETGAEARSTPVATVEAVLTAIRQVDGAGVLANVDVPAAEASDRNAISGVEEVLRQLRNVELNVDDDSRAAPVTASPASVVVQLWRKDADGAPREIRLVCVETDAGWRVRSDSMRAFLGEAPTVATGKSAKERQTAIALSHIAMACDLFKVQSRGRPPASLGLLTNPGPEGEPFLSRLPRDSWGRAYQYEVHADGTYDLRSAGPDGRFQTPDDVLPAKR